LAKAAVERLSHCPHSAIAEQIIQKRNYPTSWETLKMRHAKPPPVRNKIDLADPSQARSLKKRLGISADDLQRVVGKVGNSIAAVSKEVQQAVPATEAVPARIESANSF
jgi:hypothetical protein